ncbi:DUF6323 family protein [Lacrimispora algidixylanolytica]|uniref:Uncharacterized protein n=1 Tax=Lacrimispora algidixylanolytica TaxID=94868 RepID=A0A419T6Q2_9FIRM|nr:DUF6323 family protein [Lacrimispora algidixylanolytica]RKD33112.1 hypothetical protein BET01_15990 [Lacrimispora algidixylanolytica]
MGEEQWFQVSNSSSQVAVLKAANEYTAKFGLVLSDEETSLLLNERRDVLKKEQRVEFGEGILPKLIIAFCDSPYIHQDNYVETLGRLQEIFYFYKNESLDEYTDDELVDAMKELFDGPCQGSLDYLEDTGLQRLAKRARYGLCMDEDEEEEEEDEF